MSEDLTNPKDLILEVRHLIQKARQSAATTVNTLQVITNFEIGRRIVEHEQKGEKRASYGTALIKDLSTELTHEFGRGFSKANLEYMRRFFLEWRDQVTAIAQKPSGQSDPSSKAVPPKVSQIGQTASGELQNPFRISWSHYVTLLNRQES